MGQHVGGGGRGEEGGGELGFTTSACWYLSIGVEPLGGGHEQLLVHTVECKCQDCPGLLDERKKVKELDSPLRHNLS